MPGKDAHTLAGAGAGLLVEVFSPSQLVGLDQFWYLTGLASGGATGGRLPDVFEPAWCPNHRQFFHGIIPTIAVAHIFAKNYAAACRCTLDWARRGESGFLWPEMYDGGRGVPRAMRMFIAGFLRGIVAGYASHLALDAFTPRSLPLFGSLESPPAPPRPRVKRIAQRKARPRRARREAIYAGRFFSASTVVPVTA